MTRIATMFVLFFAPTFAFGQGTGGGSICLEPIVTSCVLEGEVLCEAGECRLNVQLNVYYCAPASAFYVSDASEFTITDEAEGFGFTDYTVTGWINPCGYYYTCKCKPNLLQCEKDLATADPVNVEHSKPDLWSVCFGN